MRNPSFRTDDEVLKHGFGAMGCGTMWVHCDDPATEFPDTPYVKPEDKGEAETFAFRVYTGFARVWPDGLTNSPVFNEYREDFDYIPSACYGMVFQNGEVFFTAGEAA